ncbi:hypothetical protein [Planktotalea sp.]|uniref:hypothetical protein n=1 Tax=Planktotalea sp. TaxID=2029877 RepID=UPI003299B88E
MTHFKHQVAKHLLAQQRQMTSLIDKEIISSGGTFEFDKTDWVPLYYDTGYAVRSECGAAMAYRAVTMDAQLLWLVFTPSKRRGYHATAHDPVQAIADAKAAWARRSMVRQNWQMVEQTARDLRRFQQRFDVRIEDAQTSPLCSLGIEGFLRSIGMGRVERISGWLAGWLMKVEPQMGFVIFEAMQRHGAKAPSISGAVPAE